MIKSSVFNSRGETESQVEILREFLEYTGKTKDSVVLWARHLGNWPTRSRCRLAEVSSQYTGPLMRARRCAKDKNVTAVTLDLA